MEVDVNSNGDSVSISFHVDKVDCRHITSGSEGVEVLLKNNAGEQANRSNSSSGIDIEEIVERLSSGSNDLGGDSDQVLVDGLNLLFENGLSGLLVGEVYGILEINAVRGSLLPDDTVRGVTGTLRASGGGPGEAQVTSALAHAVNATDVVVVGGDALALPLGRARELALDGDSKA